jgi:hypothetical protein
MSPATSVRRRCRSIYEKHDAQPGQYMTDEGIRLVAEVLDELKQQSNVSARRLVESAIAMRSDSAMGL